MAATGWTSPTGVWLPVVGAEIRSDKVFVVLRRRQHQATVDIFIIGVNPTRDSRKIQGEFLEASTRFRKHRIQCCLLHAWSQAAWPAVVVGWEV